MRFPLKMPPREPRFNGLRFFLTYPRADAISIDDVADHCHQLANSWLEIVQEDHQVSEEYPDGGIHYHVVLCFDVRYQGALNSFDVLGHHPSWEPIRNATIDLANRRHYIRKGNRTKEEQHTIKCHKTQACDYIIEPDTRGVVPEYSTTTGRLDWGGILAAATSEAEFLALARLHQPKEWILRNDNIVKYASTYYQEAREPKKSYPRDTFSVPAALDEWVAEVFSEVCFIPARSHEPPFVY